MPPDALHLPARPVLRPSHAALVALVIVTLAFAIDTVFRRHALLQGTLAGKPWLIQVGWGCVLGLLPTVPAAMLIDRVAPFLAFRRQLTELASRLDLRGFNPVWFSLFAGVGEELLFRGVLQPLWGLWSTSLVFTGLHFGSGRFRAFNLMKFAYAGTVFLASMLLGVVAARIGLLAAMVTHFVVDLVALTCLRKRPD